MWLNFELRKMIRKTFGLKLLKNILKLRAITHPDIQGRIMP